MNGAAAHVRRDPASVVDALPVLPAVAVGQPKHEHADEYTGPPEVVTLKDGRQGIAPAWMADVFRCAGMAS